MPRRPVSATSDTFSRLARANPGKVVRTGVFAELDGYQVLVVDVHSDALRYVWVLRYEDRLVTSGEVYGLIMAWRAGCDALDAHKKTVD
jgi:hypothetical protein